MMTWRRPEYWRQKTMEITRATSPQSQRERTTTQKMNWRVGDRNDGAIPMP
jgi:hypothetical protein